MKTLKIATLICVLAFQAAAEGITPAARQFRAWLEAFNSGDSVVLLNFLENQYPSSGTSTNQEAREEILSVRESSGGFEFKKAEASNARRFTGLVKERDTDTFARFTIEVEATGPNRITRLDLAQVPAPPEFAIPRMAEKDLMAALRVKLERDAAAGKFAGAVLLARNGETVFSGAYGLADRARKIPNTLDTQFMLGSMNKMFTATAVLQLVSSGKVTLEDSVGTYLSDYPNKDIAAKVTIHQLLTHTGGTGDTHGPMFNQHRSEVKTLGDYVKLFGQLGPAFEPGSKFAYSNYGMILLGLIIEKVIGVSYYDYIRDHVYKPAGMTRSGSPLKDESTPDRAIGYTRLDGAWRPNTPNLPYRGTSAGGGYSTVEDLGRFASALQNHKLLDAHYTELLTTGKVNMDRGGSTYAYGFEDTMDQGIRYFGHGGGAPGMSGALRIYPESGYVMVVLSNQDSPAARRITQFIMNRLPVYTKGP